jgi:LGFP repeat-containing protein/calcineurin-like phosphoesterase family protein
MVSKIDEKYSDLKAKGLDLGTPTSAEQDAGYGGTYRTYQKGNIYWHPVMGSSAHEVHGGILSIYTSNGGPGVSPHTGIRDFGFPLTDESTTPTDGTPFSLFEWGAIYWTQGTGGVLMYTDVYHAYRANQAMLGLPVANLATIYTGSGVFCERGLIWTHPNLKGKCLVGALTPPLMGQPLVIEADASNVSLGNVIFFNTAANDLKQALSLVPPETLSDIWKNHLVLSPVGGGADLPLSPSDFKVGSLASLESVVSISLSVQGAPADSQLYDLCLLPPTGNRYKLSPHCIYAKKSWENFGLLHATDIHLSLRNQNLRSELQKTGMTDAAQHYSNCQECFRDFIRYANHLHSLGLADAVFVTGDMIDYIAEPSDNKYTGNFERLRRMILGQPFDSGVPAYEELKIPVFMTFGNHDYRLNQFVLNFEINIDLALYNKDIPMDEFSTFNLTPQEATAAQGGPVSYGLSDYDKALAMLKYDTTGTAYAFYTKYFSPTRTFMVRLGPHRLVLLDNLYDAGVPKINGWEDLVKFFYDYASDSLSRATDRALNGCIDAAGLTDEVYKYSATALNEAGASGVVIVGMHVPPFSPVNGEYPYFLRETVHPVADPKLTKAYLDRNKFKTDGWSLTGAPYFKTGEIGNGHGLDNGVISEHGMDFVRLLAGVGLGVTRPVDLFLCGHHHDRTEYRIRWNGSDLEYYMDFYMESPSTYYSTNNDFDIENSSGKIAKGSRLAIRIDSSAPKTGSVTAQVVRQGSLSEVRGTISLPPYPTPLETASDPKQWWLDHRPIIAQTAALGPIDPRQRFDPRWEIVTTFPGSPIAPITLTVESKTEPKPKGTVEEKITVQQLMTQYPDPTFNGFRLVQVNNNMIAKVRYITLAELRAANFVLPWESGLKATTETPSPA